MSEYELFRKVEQWKSVFRGVLYIVVVVGLAVALWR
jgi:hypothetical protein